MPPAVAPTVVHNDQLSWEELSQRIAAGEFHNIVISPGPGTPDRAADIGEQTRRELRGARRAGAAGGNGGRAHQTPGCSAHSYSCWSAAPAPVVVGVILQLLRACLPIPTLGVCLGFQALAAAHGGRVLRAPEPVHGRLSAVQHSGHPMFAGIPSGPAYQVVRYHSLAVEESSLPACLKATAWTCGNHHVLQLAGDPAGVTISSEATAAVAVATCSSKGNGGCGGASGRCGSTQAASATAASPPPAAAGELLMAVAHRSLPHWGVQFHPESIATAYGAALLQNFRELTCRHHGLAHQPPVAAPAWPPGRSLPQQSWLAPTGTLDVVYQAIPNALEAVGGSEALFCELFAGHQAGSCTSSGQQLESALSSSSAGSADCCGDCATDTFWLDSTTSDRGRFSFMGGRGGPLWRRVLYKLPSLREYAEAAAGAAAAAATAAAAAAARPAAAHPRQRDAAGAGTSGADALLHGVLTLIDSAGRRWTERTALLPWLRHQLERLCCRVDPGTAAELPFNFWGGLVGYWGYELKAECGGRAAHESALPDAAFFLADRLLAVDHHTGTVYALALHAADAAVCWDSGEEDGSHTTVEEAKQAVAAAEAAARGWVDGIAACVQELVQAGTQRKQQAQQQQQMEAAASHGPAQPSVEQPQRQPQAHAGLANGHSHATARKPPPSFRLREGRKHYLANVASCMQALHEVRSASLAQSIAVACLAHANPFSMSCSVSTLLAFPLS